MFFAWLKHYMPRGIYGRAALILLLPVVVLQLVVTVVFAQRHFEGVTTQMTETVLRELALVETVVAQAPDGTAAAQAVQRELGLLDILVRPVEPVQVPQTDDYVWYDYSGRVLTALLHQALPNLRAVRLREARAEGEERRVSIYLDSPHGPMKVVFDRRRISAANPHQLFVYTIFFGVLLSYIASIYLRNQLRPIRRLARAAEAFGRGRHEPYSPAGAIEVRAAGNAFVDMRNRIERQIEQRTLMLSGVSHDLRTPLTRMRLGLSMIDEDEAEPLLQDVDDMQRMLDEFLDFAKGASEGEPEAGAGTGTIKLRKTAFRRAVDNLISNAVRYGARAEVSVMLSDKTLRVRVEDDGPGIPQDRRNEATRPFSRLDPARNQDKGGSVGLGLAITTDIARAHGGVLRLGESTRLGGLRADIVIAR